MTPQEVQLLMQMAREQGLLPMGGPDEISAALNSSRPKIRLPGDNRELLHFANEVGDVLAQRNLFRRDRSPVVVNPSKARLDSVTPQMLRSWAQQHVVFFKDKALGTGSDSHNIEIVKTMNVDTSRGLLESWQFVDKLPEIERVNPTRLPVMRSDRRIELLQPGYFAEKRIYTLDDGVIYDEFMTVERAKQVIEELLQDFPFRDDGRSKAVTIAAMFTMFCAGMLPRHAIRPGFIYTANCPGAGKTLLAKMAIVPACGVPSVRSMPKKEEVKKVLDVLAMDAATYVLFDNIRSTIGGEDIEAFITASEWEGRILSESTKFRVENVATCFFTGNDSRTTPDMQERCLFVDLFVQEADNRDRKIPKVIDDAWLAQPEVRSEILSAMWTLTKAWDAADRPAPPSRFPRFDKWSDIVAAIVAFAGWGDACAKPEIASNKGHLQEMRNLVVHLAPGAWGGGDGITEDWTFIQIMEEVKDKAFFDGVEFWDKKGEIQELFTPEGDLTPSARSFFGKTFTRFDGRTFAGKDGERLRFVVEGKGNSRRYLVVRDDLMGGPAGG